VTQALVDIEGEIEEAYCSGEYLRLQKEGGEKLTFHNLQLLVVPSAPRGHCDL